jgi:ankyrin repeat protein
MDCIDEMQLNSAHSSYRQLLRAFVSSFSLSSASSRSRQLLLALVSFFSLSSASLRQVQLYYLSLLHLHLPKCGLVPYQLTTPWKENAIAMRLLNVNTLDFREFYGGRRRPRYVVASHRWRESEASYQDLREKRNCDSEGFKKIEAFAKFVRDNIPSVEWLWLDTVCINKESMPELGEAINLMFNYYNEAELCVAYLADVESVGDLEVSEWFIRGWTLQELLAPQVVVFTSKTWQVIGNKGAADQPPTGIKCGPGLESRIAKITSIPEAVLKSYKSSSSLSVEEKRKWMEGRMTTREEDMCYALYGICGVAPGVNYGERRAGAEQRLRRAIVEKQNDVDQTIFSAVTDHSMPRLKRFVEQNPRSAIFARNESDQTALHLAAKQGNLGMVEFLLRNEAVINAEDDDDRLPLHYAVISGSASVVYALIRRGADRTAKDGRGLSSRDLCNSSSTLVAWFLDNGPNLEVKNADGWPALCLFASRRDVMAVRTLLDLGANINSIGPDLYTPLFEACKQNHEEMLQLLLARGADINSRNSRNDSILCQAGLHGHIRMGEILLDHGADIDAFNQHGSTALHQCCEHGQVDMALMLLQRGARFNIYNQRSWATIHQVCRLGQIRIVRKLLELGDDVNHIAPRIHWTPIGEASQNGRAEIVQLLLSRGADPEERLGARNHHQTPLIRAVAEGHTAVVDILLDQGKVRIETEDENGKTALYYAVTENKPDTLKQLLLRKPNLEVRDRNGGGYTPLHRAAQASQSEITRLLLKAGADPNVHERNHRWTPLHEAASRGELEIVKEFLRHGADPDLLEEHKWSPLRLAIQQSHVDVAAFLLNTGGVNIDSLDYIDETPLHEGACRGHLEIVKELVQRGAVVDRIDHAGLTPLHFAAKDGNLEVVRFLIDECDADVNHCAKSDMFTPLHQATENNYVEVVKALLQRGAKSDCRDSRGFTARNVAVKRGHLQAIEVMDSYAAKGREDFTEAGVEAVTA